MILLCSDPDEQRLTSHASQIRGLSESGLDEARLLAKCAHHRLEPHVYGGLNLCGVSPELGFVIRLKERTREIALRNLALAAEQASLVEFLRERSIDALPYKGPALSRYLYGDVAKRPCVDIDILVPRDAAERTAGALAERGLAPLKAYSAAQQRIVAESLYESSFSAPSLRCRVEVHWDVVPRRIGLPDQVRALWDRTVSLDLGGKEMPFPAADNLFLVLCLHNFKDNWYRCFHLTDVARMVALGAVADWAGLMSEARSRRVLRIVLVNLFVVRHLYGQEIPAEAAEAAETVGGLHDASDSIVRELVRAPRSVSGTVAALRFQAGLLDTRRDRLRMISSTLLSVSVGDAESFDLPRVLWPLYLLWRPFRLMKNRLLGALSSRS